MRLKQLSEELKERNIDFAVFMNLDSTRVNSNLFYFSGFGGTGVLIVPKKKRPFLIVPAMDALRAKKSGLRVFSSDKKKKLFEVLKEAVKKNNLRPRKVGLDKNSLTLNQYKLLKKCFKKCKTDDVSKACFELRETKTKEEIFRVEKACNIVDKVLQKCIRQFRSFKTESEAAAFLEYEIYKNGCDISFKPIVASGYGASMPHYVPQNTKIRKGFCVIDVGAKYKGYCSDITRTLFIGKPSEKDKEFYRLLLGVQENAVKNLKPGVKCSDIVGSVRKGLGKYGKNFIHGLGHGVGVDIHELPNFKEESKDRLKKESTFTIEPGIYFNRKFGIRIEDTVYLSDKAGILTKTTKKMVIIK